MNLLELRRRMIFAALEVEEYIVFADPVVEQICATTWGDGIGLKPSQAARVTDLGTVFKGNTSIVSFDELQYFTGLTSIYGSTQSSLMGAFYNCTNLVSVVLPQTVVSIGANAFNGSKIGDVDLTNVTSIGKNAFYSTKITSVNAPNLTSLGAHAFYKCTSLTTVTSLGSITSIPNGDSTSYGAFYQCTALTSVTLPSTLTSIGNQAFYGCTSLSSCNLPQSLTTIGTSAFHSTIITNDITLPNLTTLGPSSFYNTKVTKISNLGSITALGNSAATGGVFYSCTQLTQAILPSTLTSIGYNVFYQCTSLQSISCSSNGVSISRDAFYNCTALTSLNIKISGFGSYRAFQNCSSLVNLDLSTSTFTNTYNPSAHGNGTFKGCTKLKSVVLPSTCTVIGSGSFEGCTSLETINLDNITTIYTYAFNNNALKVNSTGIVTIPEVTVIGTFAFTKTKLVEISLPKLVTIDAGNSNANGAFFSITTLTKVDIGSDCTQIGAYTFRLCSALATLICRATTPPTLGTNALQSVSSNLKIYVPNGYGATYQAASGWSSFSSKIYELDANGNIPI